MSLAFLLFFLVLPVFNALLDWPSWAISRWLGHDLHDLMRGEARRLGRWLQRLFGRVWRPVAFGVHLLADLVAALALLLVLAAVLPFVIQLFNAAVVRFGEDAPLALGAFLDAAVREPWPNAIWPLAMLGTTLIPTALHAGALLISFFLWFIQPVAWRQGIVDGLNGDHGEALAWAAFKASWLVVLTPIAAGALVTALSYGFLRLTGLIEPVGALLLAAAHVGIDLADALAGPATP